MRKFSKLLVAIFLIVSVLVFAVGCSISNLKLSGGTGFTADKLASPKIVHITSEYAKPMIELKLTVNNADSYKILHTTQKKEVFIESDFKVIKIVEASGDTKVYNFDYTNFSDDNYSYNNGDNFFAVVAYNNDLQIQSDLSNILHLVNKAVLSAPTNVRIDGTNIMWNTVDNATGYDVSLWLNENEAISTKFINNQASNTFSIAELVKGAKIDKVYNTLEELPKQAFIIKVKAKASTTENYKDSPYSNSLEFLNTQKLTAPSISFSGRLIVWKSIAHSTNYTIFSSPINENNFTQLITQEGLSYDISDAIAQSEELLKFCVVANGTRIYTTSDNSNSLTESKVGDLVANFDYSTAMISWNTATNATKYFIYVDGVNVAETLALARNYDLSKLNIDFSQAKEVYVIASGDTSESKSNVLTITKEMLSKPVLTVDFANKKVSWNTIDNTVKYILKQNGKVVLSDASKLEFSFASLVYGNYEFSLTVEGKGFYVNAESDVLNLEILDKADVKVENNQIIIANKSDLNTYIVYLDGAEINIDDFNVNALKKGSYILTAKVEKENALGNIDGKFVFTKLETPYLQYRNNVIEFNGINNAKVSYDIYGIDKSNNEIEITSLKAKEKYTYDISTSEYNKFLVKAIGDGGQFISSEKSNIVSLSVLTAPKAEFKDGNLSWIAVNNATNYKIYSFNEGIFKLIGETIAHSFNLYSKLELGNHTVGVQSCSSDANKDSEIAVINIKNTFKYKTPSFVSCEDNVLSWTNIEGANYRVEYKFNGTIGTMTVENNDLDFNNLGAGLYEIIKVYAIHNAENEFYLDSDAMEYNQNITIRHQLNAPSNITEQKNKLIWDAVDFAFGYKLTITENNLFVKSYNVQANELDITLLQLTGGKNYVFTVQAMPDSSGYFFDSEKSEDYMFDTAFVGKSDFTYIRENVIGWNKPANATLVELRRYVNLTEYKVINIDGQEYTINETDLGTYTFVVVAFGDNIHNYTQDSYSEFVYEVKKLDKPVYSNNNGVLSYTEIQNAKEYFVSITGKNIINGSNSVLNAILDSENNNINMNEVIQNLINQSSLPEGAYGKFYFNVNAKLNIVDNENISAIKYLDSDITTYEFIIKHTLDTPNVQVGEDGTITWTADNEAKLYYIIMDGKVIADVANNGETLSYYLDNALTTGTYLISVVAVGDNMVFENSPNSNVVEIKISNSLYTPTVTFDKSNKTISWTKIPNATHYQIFYNGFLTATLGSTLDKFAIENTLDANETLSKLQVVAVAKNSVDETVKTSEISNTITIEHKKIISPVLTRDNNRLKWNHIEIGVSHYIFSYEDNNNIISKEYKLPGSIVLDKINMASTGNKSFSVIAVSDKIVYTSASYDGMIYTDSDDSDTFGVNYTRLAIPTLVYVSNATSIRWGKISNADKYEVYRNDVLLDTVTQTADGQQIFYSLVGKLDLTKENFYKVKAIKNNKFSSEIVSGNEKVFVYNDSNFQNAPLKVNHKAQPSKNITFVDSLNELVIPSLTAEKYYIIEYLDQKITVTKTGNSTRYKFLDFKAYAYDIKVTAVVDESNGWAITVNGNILTLEQNRVYDVTVKNTETLSTLVLELNNDILSMNVDEGATTVELSVTSSQNSLNNAKYKFEIGKDANDQKLTNFELNLTTFLDKLNLKKSGAFTFRAVQKNERIGTLYKDSINSLSVQFVLTASEDNVAPKNLRIENGVLIWDFVRDTASYKVYVNNNNAVTVTTNSYTISKNSYNKENIYKVASFKFSTESEKVELKATLLDSPNISEELNFDYTTETYSWNKVVGASGYNVYIKDTATNIEHKFGVQNNKFVLTDYKLFKTLNGDFTVKVATVVNGCESAKSAERYLSKLELSQPTIDSDSGKISWARASGASGYLIYDDGVLIANVSANEFTPVINNWSATTIIVKLSIVAYSDNVDYAKSLPLNFDYYVKVLLEPNATINSHGVLIWDSQPNVVNYQITINGKVITQKEENYDISLLNLEAGNYSVKIKALGNNICSFSSKEKTIEFNIIKLESPTDIIVQGSYVYWNEVNGVENYKISIYKNNNLVYEDSITKNYLDIAELKNDNGNLINTNEVFTVKIQAVNNNKLVINSEESSFTGQYELRGVGSKENPYLIESNTDYQKVSQKEGYFILTKNLSVNSTLTNLVGKINGNGFTLTFNVLGFNEITETGELSNVKFELNNGSSIATVNKGTITNINQDNSIKNPIVITNYGTISNIIINIVNSFGLETYEYGGFVKVNNGIIKDTTINVQLNILNTTSGVSIGAIVFDNAMNGVIDNVVVYGNMEISTNNSNSMVAGIITNKNNGLIKNSSNFAYLQVNTPNSNNAQIGGIAYSNIGTIQDSFAYGDLTAFAGSNAIKNGKIIASAIVAMNSGKIENVKVMSNIFSTEISAGMVGVNYGSINNVEILSKKVTGYYVVGGAVAINYGSIKNINAIVDINLLNNENNGIAGGIIAINYNLVENVKANVKITNPLGSSDGTNSQIIGAFVAVNESIDDSNAVINNAEVFANGTYGYVVSGFAVYNRNGAIIRNAQAKGNISGIKVAGLVVENDGELINSSFVGTIIDSEFGAGAVLVAKDNSRISNSFADVNATGKNIAGFVYENNADIDNSYVVGRLTGENIETGFVYNNNGIIVNVYTAVIMNVDNSVSNYVFLAESTPKGRLFNSFYDSTLNKSKEIVVMAESFSGYKGLTSAQMTSRENFVNVFNSNDIWQLTYGRYPSIITNAKQELMLPIISYDLTVSNEISWDSIANATSYLIIAESGNQKISEITSATTFDLSTNSNLDIAKEYKVSIYAIDDTNKYAMSSKAFEYSYRNYEQPELDGDTYLIKNKHNLAWVVLNPDKNYKLMDDIDLNDVNWTPIGSKENPFNGNFNGNNKKIANFNIDSSAENTGLFAVIGTAGRVYDFNIELDSSVFNINRKLNGTAKVKLNFGILAGINNGIINNIEIIGNDVRIVSNITANDFIANIGTFVGLNNGVIENNATTGNVNSEFVLSSSSSQPSTYNVGYIGNNTKEVYNISAESTLTVNKNLGSGKLTLNYGGVTGHNSGIVADAEAKGVTIKSVNGHYINIGGIVGKNRNGVIRNSKVTSGYINIISTNKDSDFNLGGIVGDNYVGSTLTEHSISNCVAEVDITVTNLAKVVKIGGIVGNFTAQESGIKFGLYNNKTAQNKMNTILLSGDSIIGGIAGELGIGAKILNNSAEGVVIEGTIVGGLVGLNRGSIIGSDVYGLSQVTGQIAGGLVGRNMGSISRCSSTARVIAANSDTYQIGGGIGNNEGGSVDNCIVNNTIEIFGINSVNKVVGGFIGQNRDGSIVNIISINVFENVNKISTAGFVDRNSGGMFKNCYFDKNKSGLNYATATGELIGVLGHQTVILNQVSTYEKWGNKSYWLFVDGAYPILKNVGYDIMANA